MCAQRVRVGESRVEMQIAKWTAEGAVKGSNAEYSVTCGHTSVAGDMMVFRQVYGDSRKARWHRGWYIHSSLTVFHCHGRVFLLEKSSQEGRIYVSIIGGSKKSGSLRRL